MIHEKNNKLIPLILLSSLFIVMGLLFFKRVETKSQEATNANSQSDDSNALKTYVNQDLGYTFMYPEKLSLEESDTGIKMSYLTDTKSQTSEDESELEYRYAVLVNLENNPGNKTPDTVFRQYCSEIECPAAMLNECQAGCLKHYLDSKEEITVGEVTGIKAERTFYESAVLQALFPLIGKMLKFSLSEPGEIGSGYSTESLQTFDEIVSSVKFTKNK